MISSVFTPPAVVMALPAIGRAVKSAEESLWAISRSSSFERFASLFSAVSGKSAETSLGGSGNAFFTSVRPSSIRSLFMSGGCMNEIVISSLPFRRYEKFSGAGPEMPREVMTALPVTVFFFRVSSISRVMPSALFSEGVRSSAAKAGRGGVIECPSAEASAYPFPSDPV